MVVCVVFAAQAASALCTAAGAGTPVRTSLSGKDALSPIAWVAPEVLAGSLATGVTATPASDVYMLGGLMFEVLTCGLIPYYWMSDMRLVAQVRLSRRCEMSLWFSFSKVCLGPHVFVLRGRECCCAGFTSMDSGRPVANRSNRTLQCPRRCEATWIRDGSDVGSETVYTGSACSLSEARLPTAVPGRPCVYVLPCRQG